MDDIPLGDSIPVLNDDLEPSAKRSLKPSSIDFLTPLSSEKQKPTRKTELENRIRKRQIKIKILFCLYSPRHFSVYQIH